MVVNQVYSIVNSLQSQLFGSSAIAVTDTRGLRALGQQLSGSNLYDKFTNALVDRIGKTIVRTLDSKLEFPGLLRTEFEFGAMLQKVNVNIPDSDNNSAWDIANPGFTPDQFDVTVPDVKVVYFKGQSTFRVRITIPDEPMLNSAFMSAEEMAAFIQGISDSMEKSMIEKLNAVSKAAIASAFVEKADLSSASVINMLTLYNSTHTPTISTPEEANESPEFQRWLSYQMGLTLQYLDTASELYNEPFPDTTKIARRSDRQALHVWILSQVANANKAFMASDTFWRDMVSLPFYKEVKMWQGSGTSPLPTLADASTIHALAENGDDVEMTYVIAAFADREAIGVCKYDLKTASDRNNINGYTNLATMANLMYAVDLTENIVVFTLADPTITP